MPIDQPRTFDRLVADGLIEAAPDRTRRRPRLVEQFDDLYGQLDRVEVDEALVRRAGQLAQDHALRGYGAVHLAAFERIADDRTVMVAGDDDLVTAAAALGMATASTSQPRP